MKLLNKYLSTLNSEEINSILESHSPININKSENTIRSYILIINY